MNSSAGRRIGLVGCVKEKAREPRPARDLYTSTLFIGCRRFVERTCDAWWILSAEHGLVHPDEVLAPYDLALKSLGHGARREWSRRVLVELDERAGLRAGDTVEFHAGAEYRDFGLADGLRARGIALVNPTEGRGIGTQFSFYKHVVNS